MLEGSSVFYCKTFPGCCEVVEACWHHRSGVFLRTVEKSGVWLINPVNDDAFIQRTGDAPFLHHEAFYFLLLLFSLSSVFFFPFGFLPCVSVLLLFSSPLLPRSSRGVFLSGLACQRYSPLFLLTSLAIIHLDHAPGPFQSPLTPAFPVSDEWKRSDFPPGC